VGELSLTVTSEGSIGCLLSKVERVENSCGSKSSSVSIEGSRESSAGLSKLGGSECSSRSEEGGEDKLHFDIVFWFD
jgi:hypothetical protein